MSYSTSTVSWRNYDAPITEYNDFGLSPTTKKKRKVKKAVLNWRKEIEKGD